MTATTATEGAAHIMLCPVHSLNQNCLGEELGRAGDRVESAGTAQHTGQKTGEARAATGNASARAQRSTGGDRKPAGTGTAVRAINEKVRKGDIKIEGMTDADMALP